MRYCGPGFTSRFLFSSSLFQNCATVRAVDTVNTARAVDTVAKANTVGTVGRKTTRHTVDTVGTLDTVAFLGKSHRLSGVCVYWFTVFCFHFFIFVFAFKCVRFSFVAKTIPTW